MKSNNPSQTYNQPSEVNPLRSSFDEQVQNVRSERQMLNEYVENIRNRQYNWLHRLTTTKEEKQLLDTFWKKQDEALQTVLTDRNTALKIVGEAQLAFIREVCDSLTISARSQVQLNRSTAFQKRFLALTSRLEQLNESFFLLTATKIDAIKRATGRIKEIQLQQLERMLTKWDDTYASALEEFASIIQKRHTS